MTHAVPDVVTQVLAAQSRNGAFPSTVHVVDREEVDENAFVTALVVHELSPWAGDKVVRRAIDRALDFLLRCELRGGPGHFCFYPETARPAWMPVPLPADSDDTALVAPLLVQYGRRPLAFLQEVVDEVLDPFRLLDVCEASEKWHRAGVYLTWLRAGYPPNVVDCCVNVNVLALLARAGRAASPAAAAVVEMLEAALSSTPPWPPRTRTLSPWYPHPAEFVRAVERAASAGAAGLGPVLTRMRAMGWNRPAAGAPVCGSKDGRFLWTCDALQALRAGRLR